MSRRRLGSLLSGLVVSLVAAAAFCALAWCIDDKKVFGPLARPTDEEHALVQFDKRVANEMNEARQANPEVKKTLERVTHAGSLETLVMVAIAVSLAALRWRQFGLLGVWFLVLAGGDYLEGVLKDVFQRPRPVFATSKTFSFPSGHAMMSMIGYGMLAYVLVLVVPRPWMRVLLVLALVLVIGFTRIFLVQHYVSDVMGGFAAGLAWLGGCIGITEAIRRGNPPTPGKTNPL